MYIVEKEINPKDFSSYADALWWGVVSRHKLCFYTLFGIVFRNFALSQLFFSLLIALH